MRWLLVLLLVVVAATLVYFRFAPSDPGRWHVDPLTAPDPGKGNARIAPPDAPVFDMTPEELMAAFDRVAMAEPRVTRLAGSVGDGFATYIARSRVFGFPDYISVRALPADGGGATLAIFSRQRFGRDDMGVNGKRLDDWLGKLGS